MYKCKFKLNFSGDNYCIPRIIVAFEAVDYNLKPTLYSLLAVTLETNIPITITTTENAIDAIKYAKRISEIFPADDNLYDEQTYDDNNIIGIDGLKKFLE